MAITIKGIDFIDAKGIRVRNYSLISDDTGYAIAIADFNDSECVRFSYVEDIADLMPHWMTQLNKLLRDGAASQAVPYSFEAEIERITND